MSRLNTRIRNDIVESAIVKAGITEAKDNLRERRIAWAEAVRIDAIGGSEAEAEVNGFVKRIKRALGELPSGLAINRNIVNNVFSMSLNLVGSRVAVYFNGATSRYGLDHVWKISPNEHTIKADNPLVDEFHRMEKQDSALEAKETALRANVRATVSKFGTIKRLTEAWPEVSELLPKDLSPPSNNLPAIRVEDLNSMIGLPTGEAA